MQALAAIPPPTNNAAAVSDVNNLSIFPATKTLSPEDLIRVRASTDESVSTVVEWEGQVLYVILYLPS